jgi:hypothetical protein
MFMGTEGDGIGGVFMPGDRGWIAGMFMLAEKEGNLRVASGLVSPIALCCPVASL